MELNVILGSLICAHDGCWKSVRALHSLPPSLLLPNQPRAPTIPLSTRVGVESAVDAEVT